MTERTTCYALNIQVHTLGTTATARGTLSTSQMAPRLALEHWRFKTCWTGNLTLYMGKYPCFFLPVSELLIFSILLCFNLFPSSNRLYINVNMAVTHPHRCSGPLPSPNWTIGSVDLPGPEIQAARRTQKKANRVVVPLSQQMGLYYHPSVFSMPDVLSRLHVMPESLSGATPGLAILGGPSAFSPECWDEYRNLHQLLLNAPHNRDHLGQRFEPPYSVMPQNWNVVVERHSLARLLACFKYHYPSLFWTSKAGYVYPMLYIPGDDCWSWTPRDFSSWVPASEIRRYLDEYEYVPRTVDPRVPAMYWPVDGTNLYHNGSNPI